jgi:hypothetical protein
MSRLFIRTGIERERLVFNCAASEVPTSPHLSGWNAAVTHRSEEEPQQRTPQRLTQPSQHPMWCGVGGELPHLFGGGLPDANSSEP